MPGSKFHGACGVRKEDSSGNKITVHGLKCRFLEERWRGGLTGGPLSEQGADPPRSTDPRGPRSKQQNDCSFHHGKLVVEHPLDETMEPSLVHGKIHIQSTGDNTYQVSQLWESQTTV